MHREFGRRLKKLMKERGMTQMDLAEKSGISQQVISRWCTGQNSTTINVARDVKEALGCTWDELLG